ncbi:MAG: hypothetical protein FWC10_07625 [Lentimicrobiaceae bacterium]|nr:hypothetical protein [Lentimicrobiaceae bacterium]
MLKIFGKWSNEKVLSSLPSEDINVDEKKVITNTLDHETIAAITMALHLSLNEFRDEESEVVTIDVPSARYSPWAQKNLVMRRVARNW